MTHTRHHAFTCVTCLVRIHSSFIQWIIHTWHSLTCLAALAHAEEAVHMRAMTHTWHYASIHMTYRIRIVYMLHSYDNSSIYDILSHTLSRAGARRGSHPYMRAMTHTWRHVSICGKCLVRIPASFTWWFIHMWHSLSYAQPRWRMPRKPRNFYGKMYKRLRSNLASPPKCTAMTCCSVLQCVAVCSGVLRRVAVC